MKVMDVFPVLGIIEGLDIWVSGAISIKESVLASNLHETFSHLVASQTGIC